MKNKYEIRGDITAIFLKRRNGELLETLISTFDLNKVKEFPFSWVSSRKESIESYYAQSKGVLLHRYIMDAPKGMFVDHIDHNGLNNTRENLRIVTPSQNQQNRQGAMKNNKTGIRNVCWRNDKKRWQVAIGVNGKVIHVGTFKDKEEAEKVATEARKKYMPYSTET